MIRNCQDAIHPLVINRLISLLSDGDLTGRFSSDNQARKKGSWNLGRKQHAVKRALERPSSGKSLIPSQKRLRAELTALARPIDSAFGSGIISGLKANIVSSGIE